MTFENLLWKSLVCFSAIGRTLNVATIVVYALNITPIKALLEPVYGTEPCTAGDMTNKMIIVAFDTAVLCTHFECDAKDMLIVGASLFVVSLIKEAFVQATIRERAD